MALRFLNSGYFAGKVGIGIESPLELLHLESTEPLIRFDDTNSGIHYIVGQDGDGFKFTTNNSTYGKYTFDSNVGIGEESPSAKLQITTPFASSPSDSIFLFTNGSNIPGGGSEIIFGSSTSATPVNYNAKIAGVRSSLDNGSSDLWFQTTHVATAITPTTKMIIKSDGKVGIGTDDPTSNLHVKTGSNTTVLIEGNQNTRFASLQLKNASQLWVPRLEGTTLDFVIRDDTASSEPFRINPATSTGSNDSAIIIDGNGNVGMGYASPSDFTSVYADNLVVGPLSGNNGITVNSATSGYGALAFADGTGASDQYRGLIQYNHTANSLALFTNASTKMTILSGGNVGINDTSPDFKLDVGGTFGVSDLPFNSTSISVLVANETLGTELITNGDFSVNTGWGVGGGWTIANGKASGDNASTSGLTQSIAVVSGSVYKVSLEVSGYASGSLQPQFGGSQVIASINANGKYDYTVTSTVTNTVFYLYGVGDFELSVDNVSIKQITSASDQIQKREISSDVFTGGPFLPLAGGTMTGTNGITMPDSFPLLLGTSGINDSQIFWDGDNIEIQARKASADIVFRAANSSGVLGEFLAIDGGVQKTRAYKDIHFQDNIKATFGDTTNPDLQIYHDISNSYISDTGTGILAIQGNIIALENTSGANYFVGVDGAQAELYYNGSSKLQTTNTGVSVTGDIQIDSALLSNQQNTDVDTGTETVASVAIATYTAAFFDFVIKKTTNVRSGTVYACHDGGSPTTLVAFTETSTQDLGDTSDVTLSVVISGTNMELQATTTSDNWSIKSLIRAI